jgi:hypothetical protein
MTICIRTDINGADTLQAIAIPQVETGKPSDLHRLPYCAPTSRTFLCPRGWAVSKVWCLNVFVINNTIVVVRLRQPVV